MRTILGLTLVLACFALAQDGSLRANPPIEGKKREPPCKGMTDKQCKQEYESRYKQHYENEVKANPKREQLQFRAKEPEAKRDPRDLVPGLRTDYQPPATVAADKLSEDSFVAFREKDRAAALASTGDAKSFSAHPDFLTDGQNVKTCGEYVFKKFLDWSRYEDQVFACKEDLRCMYDVAMSWLPGRTLKDAAGASIPSMTFWRQTSSSKPVSSWYEALPKNPFFSIELPPLGVGPDGTKLFENGQPVDPVAVILPELKDDLPAIRALLAKGGGDYYVFGTSAGPGQEGFADEWDYHRKMRERTDPVEQAMRDEIGWRRLKLEKILARVGAFRWSVKRNDLDEQAGSRDPSITLGPDPWERQAMYGDVAMFNERYSAAVAAYDGRQASARGGAAMKSGRRGRGAKKVKVTAGAIIKPGWQPDPKNRRRFLCTPKTTPITDTSVRGGKATESYPIVDQCEAWNMLFEEYDRLVRNRKQGCTAGSNCGCLHLAENGEPQSYACDWSLEDFAGRWVKPNHYVRDRAQDWNFCQRFRGSPTSAETATLASFEKALEHNYEIYQRWKKIPTVSDSVMLSFGQDYQSGSTAGDKDTFAASYDYDAGWQLEPNALVPGTTKVCQLSARAWGAFHADAWILKHDALRLVDAAAWIIANKASKKEPLGNRKVEHSAHFTLLGLQLFTPLPPSLPDVPKLRAGWYNFQSKDPDDSGGDGQTFEVNQELPQHSKQHHPDIEIPEPPLSATILLGPVPVTVSAGGGISFGTKLKPSVQVPKGCEHQIKEMGVELSFTPHVGAGAFVAGGVGVPGCEVAIRTDVNLVDLGVPVNVRLGVENDKKDGPQLEFGVGVDGVLTSLGGKVSLEFQFIAWNELVTLFKWSGLGPYDFEIVPEIGGKYPLPDLESYVSLICSRKGDDRTGDKVCTAEIKK